MNSSHTTEIYDDQNTATSRVYALRADPELFNVRLIQTMTVGFFDKTRGNDRRIEDNIPYGQHLYLVQYENTKKQPQPPSAPPIPGGESVVIS